MAVTAVRHDTIFSAKNLTLNNAFSEANKAIRTNFDRRETQGQLLATFTIVCLAVGNTDNILEPANNSRSPGSELYLYYTSV